MVSSRSWWASKVRQFRSHLRAHVNPLERAALASWVEPRQLEVFDAMHVADRRHGLAVVATLRADGATDNELLLAGLLHDAGKGDTGIWPRVAYSLGQQLITTAFNVGFAILLICVVFGWQGGSKLVKDSYSDAKVKKDEMGDERREKRDAKREARRSDGRRGLMRVIRRSDDETGDDA